MRTNEESQNRLNTAGAKLIFSLFLVWLISFGWTVVEHALKDSDTCWILAMGRWIIEHRALPGVDPFSCNISTLATLEPFPYLVEYQWLTEIILYSIYHWTSSFGLLALASIIAYFTFVWLPYSILTKVSCHHLVIFLIIFLLGTTATFSFYVRSQMFSCLFLAVLVYFYIPSKLNLSPINRNFLFAIPVLTLLWANIHIFLLPVGLLFIVMLLWSRFVELRIMDNDKNFPFSQLWILLVAIFVTALNPWGFNLWAYVLRLSHNPNNYYVPELQMLSPLQINIPPIFYFDSLLVLYFLLCLYISRFNIKKIGCVSPVLFIVGLFMAISYRKLLPMSILFILSSYAELMSRQLDRESANRVVSKVVPVWEELSNQISSLVPNKVIWTIITLMATLIGSGLAYVYKPVTVPQSSTFFAVPFNAIQFLKTHRPDGKLFNDAKFGALMTLYIDNPGVFIDTRYSQYEPQVMDDYICLQSCGYGWQNLLQKYGIRWIFVEPWQPIAKALQGLGWKTVYHDDTACIIIKQ